MRNIYLILLLLVTPLLAKGQTDSTQAFVETVDSMMWVSKDSVSRAVLRFPDDDSYLHSDCCRFRAKQLIAPATLIAMGATGLMDKGPIHYINKHAAEDMNPHGHVCKADDYIQYVPTATHLLLGLGVPSRHNVFERFVVSFTANLFMFATTKSVKAIVQEGRPDSGKKNSFFSGHTATAFTGAELVRIEYGWGYGAAAYAVAATTAYLRVYNKRHWVGDVMAGAGVGILCANAGYWMLPVWKRWLRFEKVNEGGRRAAKKESKRLVVAAPFYQAEDRAAGVSCQILLY